MTELNQSSYLGCYRIYIFVNYNVSDVWFEKHTKHSYNNIFH